ncbi:MAG: RHS repeat-associated core domain-containing protein, partial [Bacteroidales bacterium]|nr:RHS repeat-associated core domain-containing protein [Bacteroidales bacterium]
GCSGLTILDMNNWDMSNVTNANNMLFSCFALTTIYKYDNYGNILHKSTFGKEKDTVSTFYKYDDSHRLIIEENTTSPNSLMRYEYDSFDNLLSETDFTDSQNPLKTKYKYDGWGLKIETEYPDNTIQSIVRGRTNGSGGYFVAELGTASPWTKTTYDNAGHKVVEEKLSMSSATSATITTTEYTYNKFNKPETITTTADNITYTSTYSYSQSGLLSTYTDTTHTIKYLYDFNKTEVTDNGRKTVTEYDCWGNVKNIISPDNTKVSYTYFSNGNPKQVNSLDGAITFEYYSNGLKKSVTDPDAGKETYEYDSFGRIITQKRGSITTSNTYHNGVLSETLCGDIVTTYKYDHKNRLTHIDNGTAAIKYSYDNLDRIATESYSIDSKVFNYSYSYNEIGQLITKTFPDLSAETYLYNKYGTHIATQLDGKNVWKLSSCAINNISEVMNSINKKTNLNIDNTIKSITYGTASNVESLKYNYFYDTNKNLISRSNGFEKDTFAYDQSDRLIKVNNDYEYRYDPNGNITYQTGIGAYTYQAPQPHAVTDVDNAEGVISLYRQDITYTPFRRPETIAAKTLEGKNHKYTITYSPLHNRIKTEYIAYHKNITTYYLPDYEEEISDGITTSRHYIYSPTTGNLVAVNFRCGDNNETLYAVTDNLGSVLKLVDSTFRDKYSATYTPFGVRTILRNDLGYNFPRGFTMHEHLDEFGLINMNARLYDPVLARFISPDPYVQNPASSQNFNRYSYCLNNPLRYTDPSGEFAWWPIIAMSSAFATGNLVTHSSAGDIKNFGQGAKIFMQGAIVGATLGAVVQIPIVNKVLGGMWKYNKIGFAAMGAATIGSSISAAVVKGKWDVLPNSIKILGGLFSLDDTNFFGGIWQGISRFTWEALQTNAGMCYALGCNIGWQADYVNYTNGATYTINEEAGKSDGVTMGNFIGIKIKDNVVGDFANYVRTSHNGLLMHEYGHTIQGRRYGFAYLFYIGIPSLFDAKNQKYGPHKERWFEREASAFGRDFFDYYWYKYSNYPTYGF